MVFLSGAIFIVATVFTMVSLIVNEADRVLTDNEFYLILVLCVFSLLSFILSLNFRIEFYNRMEDLDKVRRRYHEATALVNAAVKKLDNGIINSIIEKVIGEIVLPSELDKQARKLAKDFPDVEIKK